MEKHLHVISFDIPIPANYGGAIDVFYKIQALYKEGVKIHLHCFQYDRVPAPELDDICESVKYYPRKISKENLFRFRPYIVVSRMSETLMQNLLKDDHPILFEGLHSCAYLDDDRLANRKKIVRTHNVEHDYYSNLAKVEKNIFKKYYFLNEAGKLKRFEKKLKYADKIACISHSDEVYFSRLYSQVVNISAFHPNTTVDIEHSMGEFCLYHGSLEVGENNAAALFLVKEVFNDINYPLIIAGNKPSLELKEAISAFPHIKIQSNLDTDSIFSLVQKAQINILPTFQATGLKLKLLAALFMGKHCLVNTPMIENTGLEDLCVVVESAKDLQLKVIELSKEQFARDDIDKRKAILEEGKFSNSYNARLLIEQIYYRS